MLSVAPLIDCVLMIGAFDETHPARKQELSAVLDHNNKLIKKIVVFREDAVTWVDSLLSGYPRVSAVNATGRMMFSDFFAYANTNLEGNLCIIANSDIAFDSSLAKATEWNWADSLCCLAKYNGADGRPGPQPEWSHDSWLFKAPIKPFTSNWYLGQPRCEQRLACEAVKAGLYTFNPYATIITRHWHHSGIRHYTKKDELPGQYVGIPISQAKPN